MTQPPPPYSFPTSVIIAENQENSSILAATPSPSSNSRPLASHPEPRGDVFVPPQSFIRKYHTVNDNKVSIIQGPSFEGRPASCFVIEHNFAYDWDITFRPPKNPETDEYVPNFAFPSFSHVWSVLRALSPDQTLRVPNTCQEYTDATIVQHPDDWRVFTNPFATHKKYRKWMKSLAHETAGSIKELKIGRIKFVKRKLGFGGKLSRSETEADGRDYPQSMNTLVEFPENNILFYEQDRGAWRLEVFLYYVKVDAQLKWRFPQKWWELLSDIEHKTGRTRSDIISGLKLSKDTRRTFDNQYCLGRKIYDDLKFQEALRASYRSGLDVVVMELPPTFNLGTGTNCFRKLFSRLGLAKAEVEDVGKNN
ncbi:hypothetical protein M422DRAFT_51326 [Sphaerobolus stellatus SS14]|uniref:Uncharacterized protein n=1 Tax=Sphaerobolus stellatus (strain SS14) TaxID=990650 RepID=A0A0C9VDM4_SPHS4|nr:hypothetical protein M422DRAFT_51326 [Sphaerobolus stellatus SS14]